MTKLIPDLMDRLEVATYLRREPARDGEVKEYTAATANKLVVTGSGGLNPHGLNPPQQNWVFI